MAEELLTVEEVAARLRSNPETVRRYLRSGKLRGVRPGGTRLGWRIPVSELDRFLAGAGGSGSQAPHH
jgi:excisionase family DNA binding protein